MILVIIFFVIGVVVGVAIGTRINKPKVEGILKMDGSDPEFPPLMFLELHSNVVSVYNKEYATFKIKRGPIETQK